MYESLPPGPERTPSQIVTEGRDLWWSNLPVLFLISVLFTAPFVVISFGLTLGLSEAVVEVDGRIDVLFAGDDDRNLHRVLSGTLAIADVLAGLVAWGAMVAYLWRRRVLKPVDWQEAVRAAFDKLGVLLRVAMLEFLIVVVAAIALIALAGAGIFAFIAAAVAAAAALVRFWPTQVVAMVEHEPAVDAMRRSWSLASRRTKHVIMVLGLTFLRLLAYGLLTALVTFLLSGFVTAVAAPTATLLWFAVSQLFMFALLNPFVAAVAVPLYVDLRRRWDAEEAPDHRGPVSG